MKPEGTSWQKHHGVTYGMWDSLDKIGRHFTEGRLYEQPLLEWIYEQPWTTDSVALDIGANIGNHALWMAKVCGLRVVAFEPVIPHVLRANAHLNGLLGSDLFEVHDCGVGHRTGTYHHVGKGVLKPGLSKESTDEVCRIETLDSFQFENVDFIKIDVEGMEASVLLSGVNTLRRYKPVLAIEAWETADMYAQKEILYPLGYKKTGVQFGGRGRAPMNIWSAT